MKAEKKEVLTNLLFGVFLVTTITYNSVKFYYWYQDKKHKKCKCQEKGSHA